jgi:hypothetical protein
MTPGELVRAVADCFGIDYRTVFQIDRKLVEAGHRKKSGRGLSAARMDASDAANLLIATAAAPISGPSVIGSAAAFEKFANLKAQASKNRGLKNTWQNIRCLSHLPPGHTFADALAELIRQTANGSLDKATHIWPELLSPGVELYAETVGFSISLTEPNCEGQIRIEAMGLPPEEDAVEETMYYTPDENTFAWSNGDLSQHREFSEQTIRRIASHLRVR